MVVVGPRRRLCARLWPKSDATRKLPLSAVVTVSRGREARSLRWPLELSFRGLARQKQFPSALGPTVLVPFSGAPEEETAGSCPPFPLIQCRTGANRTTPS